MKLRRKRKVRGYFQNLQRAPRQQRFFNTKRMSLLALSTPRTRKISKRQKQFDTSLTFPRRSKKNPMVSMETPLKKEEEEWDQEKTIKLEQIFPDLKNPNPHLHYYQSYNSYTLGSINSLSLSNGKFYDLLQLRKDSLLFLRNLKCRCSRSKCIAKYCECFSKGKACGKECGCLSCQNIKDHDPDPKVFEQTRICRCTKSQCLKNYCECHQRGEPCSSRCRCQNCKNTGKQQP